MLILEIQTINIINQNLKWKLTILIRNIVIFERNCTSLCVIDDLRSVVQDWLPCGTVWKNDRFQKINKERQLGRFRLEKVVDNLFKLQFFL